MEQHATSGAGERRGFLRKITGILGAALGAVVALPGLGMLFHPLRRDTISGGKDPLPVGKKPGDIVVGQPVMVELRGELRDGFQRMADVKLGSCWLVKKDETAPVKAYSTVCPHLGCGIDWDGDRKEFVCPCHDSYFDLDGNPLTGPSPRGMDELAVQQDAQAVIHVSYRRFRLGTSEKVEV